MTYQVQAIRAGNYWELHIKGEGVTQSRTLAEATEMVRDWLALEYERDFTHALVNVQPVLDNPDAIRAYTRESQTRKSQRAPRRVARSTELVHS